MGNNPITFSYPSINSLITYERLKLRVHQEWEDNHDLQRWLLEQLPEKEIDINI